LHTAQPRRCSINASRGAQYRGLPARVVEQCEAPAGIALVNRTQACGLGYHASYLPTETVSVLVIASDPIRRTDEGADCAEANGSEVACVAHVALGGDCAAQPALLVGDDDARIVQHSVD
jgi:hypothetical protein